VLLRASAAALGGAAASALLELGSGVPWRAALLSVLLALPWALLASLGWLGLTRAGARSPRRDAFLRAVLVMWSFVATFAGLAVVANFVLLGLVFDRQLLWAYGVAAPLAGGVAYRLWRALRSERLRPGPEHAIVLLVVSGVALGVRNLQFHPYQYAPVHWALWAGSLCAFVLAAQIALERLRWGGWLILALVAPALVVTATLLEGGELDRMARALAEHPTGGRVLQVARTLLDRDGDGFSSELAGGDCDDGDPRAYPLSTSGRDCLRWVVEGAERGRPRPAPQAASSRVSSGGSPRAFVLLTADAFRCGFGVRDRSELRSACPQLTALAREGRFRSDAYSIYPGTAESVGALLTVSDEQTLEGAMRARGFETHAIVTHEVARELATGFETVDDTLVEASTDRGATAADVTTLVLETLRNLERRQASGFVWGHYFDTHAPYVDRAHAVWRSSPIEQYAAEVRRVDAEIGRLVEALRRSELDVTLVFTADHGEDLGEHGRTHHGTSLYEPAVRVPLLVWRAGPAPRRGLGARLPQSLASVGNYVLSVADGRPVEASDGAFLLTRSSEDHQVGYVLNGWKLIYHVTFAYPELYDLRTDPFETRSLADSEPERVRALGMRLGAELWRARRFPTR
jgi:hypothetical protein